jgi:hypothetical protein
MMKCDTTTLTQIIDKCFDYSGDGRLRDTQRTEFLTLGKRLRGSLLNLLSAQFEDNTEAIQNANADLTRINTQLLNDVDTLSNVDATLEEINSLVGTLDKLIGIAISFI